MVARMWTGVVADGRSGERYLAHLRSRVVPSLRSLPGYRGMHVLRRVVGDGEEFVVTTLWENVSAIQAFTGPDVEVAVVAEEARRLLTRFSERATHYDVVEWQA